MKRHGTVQERHQNLSGRADAAPATALRLALAVILSTLLFVFGCGGGESEGTGADLYPEGWTEPCGRFTRPPTSELTEEQLAAIERLESIGYLGGTATPTEVSGTTAYERGRACDGLNFFTSGHEPGAYLMDMDGNVIHRWYCEFIDAWRAGPRGPLPRSTKSGGFWRRAYLFENGDVLGIYDGLGLVKLDKDSNIIWSYMGAAHHDLEVMDDGRIFVLTREAHIVPRIHPDEPILEDFVTELDSDGREVRSISLLEAFENSEKHSALLAGMKPSGDVFHTNTVEVLDGRISNRMPPFKRGRVLVCVRELDAVAVVDLDEERVVWAIVAPWKRPHQPTVLDNGNIMIFDNRGFYDHSRIIEFDPRTTNIVWDYAGDEPSDFSSPECGSAIRLANGNTLITETDRGRAFEVTPERDTVWEYVNPTTAGENNVFMASIFEMIRLEPDFPVDWLDD